VASCVKEQKTFRQGHKQIPNTNPGGIRQGDEGEKTEQQKDT
jgi:hypothetical protein